MRHFLMLFASSLLFACGGGDSSEEKTANPIDETAESMHNALDKAENVGAVLEEQKKSIDDALDEADPD
jgi:hypothetical protein